MQGLGAEVLAELSRHCSLREKTSSDGNQKDWRGCKLHVDGADGRIPISAILTVASLHDSKVAIPLATMTARRVTSLYDVIGSAYHAGEIIDHRHGLGHVQIIKPPKQLGKKIAFSRALPGDRWRDRPGFRRRPW